VNIIHRCLPLLLVAGAVAVPAAHAAQAGDWELKVGVHAVDPKSGNGDLADGAFQADVGSSTRPTISLEYRVTANLGLEVLGALPFQHDVKLNGTKAATVKQLPPTVTLNWHFLPEGKVDPFLGVGFNYTRFFSIREKGPLEGTSLDLDDSWGASAHAGVAFALTDRWSLTGDVRWARIRSKAKLNGDGIGTVTIDPLVYGLAVGYRF